MSLDPAPDTAPPLDGVRVVDLSRVLAGPHCTQILADQGALVTKVEPPTGDETRDWGPPFADGLSAYFAGLNRSKRTLALDLATGEGRGVLHRLLEGADVLVDNFRAGTMERWGLSHRELSERYPRLVHCRITGFGVDGPESGRPGYDAALQAYGGLMSVNGEPDGPPLRVGVPVVDLTAGLLAANGVLLALHDRVRTGRGQLVDVALLDAAVSLLHPQAANWFMDGVVPGRLGSGHPNIVPYETFAARDGTLFVGAANDRQFHALCRVLDRIELSEDPRFTHNRDRVVNRGLLLPLLRTRIAERGRDELVTALVETSVPAAPVNDIGEVLRDPQVHHRRMVVETDGYRGLGVPVKLSRSASVPPTPPPRFGAHTRAILAELGYDAASIDRLAAGGVVADADAPAGGRG